MAKWFEIEKQVDMIKENQLEVDLKFSIGRFSKWFISNVFGRALSYLVGWTGSTAKMLRCTSGGILKVAIAGIIYEYNDVKTGTSANAYTGGIAFDDIASKVEIWAYTNDVLVKRSVDGVSFQDEWIIESGGYHEIEGSTLEMDIKSKVGGVHSTYQIIGWW